MLARNNLISVLCNFVTPPQVTPLHLAVGFNHGFNKFYSSVEVVRALIEAGADVNAVDSNQMSPLHLASSLNWVVVPLLLEAGAKVNVMDKRGLTPLWFAAVARHKSVIAALLMAGADPRLGGKEGKSPLKNANSDMRSYIRLQLHKLGREGGTSS